MGSQRRWQRTGTRALQSGFSLVELAVVLVVIGVILAAISIGRDLHRGAEGLQIYAKFVQPWAIAYNEYFARTGVVVGDNVPPGNVTLKVAAEHDRILCDSGAPSATLVDYNAFTGTLRDLMLGVGIEMPPGRAVGRENRFVYLDSNGNPQETRICFQNIDWLVWDPDANAGAGAYVSKEVNVMTLIGLTPDLARRLDSIIDGTPQPCAGLFRMQEALAPDSNACAWGVDNTMAFGSLVSTSLDESQVAVVTAHYRMDQ